MSKKVLLLYKACERFSR